VTVAVSPDGLPALVLNADYRPLSYYPLSLWGWQDAIKAVFLDRVNIVAEYDRSVSSVSFSMKLPSVVSLKNYVKPSRHPAFTRFNVFLRDRFSCQYCGAREDLTFDHLIPRALGLCGSFLDLVAMNLAGGRGVPEALQAASEVTDGWAMVRIRDTLLSARLHGVTPWAALGELGEEIRIDELRDLAAALALVAEDGAKVRESLAARATSMRRRELAEAEGKAGEKSQSMLVAQLLLCLGFLIFLVYPATANMLGF
jgi:5-methylcytosine-specific restriction endonuclease McrA